MIRRVGVIRVGADLCVRPQNIQLFDESGRTHRINCAQVRTGGHTGPPLRRSGLQRLMGGIVVLTQVCPYY